MNTFYLNSDRSIIGKISDDGKVILSSNHSNPQNLQNLLDNINRILTVKNSRKTLDIDLNGKTFVSINKQKKIVKEFETLTSFETRLFAQGKTVNTTLPFLRFEKRPKQLKTDLHTHFAGALTPELLVNSAVGLNISFPKWILDKIKINYSFLTPNEKDEYLLEDVIANQQNKTILFNSMKIDTSEQETFNKMEEIYNVRGPITKNPNAFIPILKEIALDAQKNGVEYLELSLSSIISSVGQLRLLEEFMPSIENETGVKIRFLGAMWRHSDKEWNTDEVDRLKVSSLSPYVVGCDFMGHETNSTMEFYENIKELAKYAIMKDHHFVIRVHAGENPLFKANARQVLLAVEEAHYELSQSTKKQLPYPQVRLGHGLYGFDEPATWDEKERTTNLTMLDLCKKINPIIEFNMSSNLSLNNINELQEVPIKTYLDSDIRVVLGTDGKGIYSTDLKQEMILAKQVGLDQDDFKRIEKTEKEVIKNANIRFRKHKKNKTNKIEEGLKNCYSNGICQYTQEVEKRNKEQILQLQKDLTQLIQNSGAITDIKQVNKDTSGKIPIMITGSSLKHWPKISEENKQKIKIVLDVLIHAIDTNNAYLVTGGTNHGVEKEAHILANKFNTIEKGNLCILGTLTEEAAKTETNSIEKDTITHAIIPMLNGKPAKRWFDLPDTVLNIISENNGFVIAFGGGPIVSDIIQRSHNMGLNLNIMSGIEGASGAKAKSLDGNKYDFSDVKSLILKIIHNNPKIIKKDINEEMLDHLITKSYQAITSINDEANINKNKEKKMETKILKMVSLNPTKYPDKEVECRVVEDMANYVKAFIEYQGEKGIFPQYAQKTVKVKARKGELGEEVDTRPRVKKDGNIYVIGETKGKVKVEGSMIVENPDGEEYIVKPNIFTEKYDQTQEDGIYAPITKPIKYIILTEDIVFKAPWGEDMYGLKGAALIVSNPNDVYAVQNEAFEKTYTEKNPFLGV